MIEVGEKPPREREGGKELDERMLKRVGRGNESEGDRQMTCRSEHSQLCSSLNYFTSIKAGKYQCK